jgi:hypothetical protein
MRTRASRVIVGLSLSTGGSAMTISTDITSLRLVRPIEELTRDDVRYAGGKLLDAVRI